MLLFLSVLCLPDVSGSYVVNECNTKACQEEAASIRRDMDDTVIPCDNFYQFACKNFLNQHSAATHMQLLTDKMRKVETKILEGKQQLQSYRTLGLMSNFYKSCMNEDQVEKVGLRPVQEILRKIDGWPVLNGQRSSYSVRTKEIMERLWENGLYIHPFFTMRPGIRTINENGQDKNKFIIMIGCGEAGSDVPKLKSEYDEKTVNQYLDYMKKTAELFGASRETAIADMKKTLELEIKLINMTCKNKENVNPTKLEDMDRLYPGMEWSNYLKNYLAKFSPAMQSRDIYVMAPDYLADVVKLITDIEKRDMRTLRNYMGWFVVRNYPYYLTKQMTAMREDFCKKTKCYIEKRSRREVCEELIRYNFMFADELGIAYQLLDSDENTISTAQNMIEKLREDLKRKIYSMSWMDPEQFDKMKKQIDSVKFGVGVPNKWNTKFVDKLYEKVTLDSEEFYENVLKITSFNLRHADSYQENTQLYGGNIKVHIKADIPKINFQIKTAILQGIYFRKDRPQAMNYAGLGVTLLERVLSSYYSYLKHDDKKVPGQKKLAKLIRCFKERYQNATRSIRPTEKWTEFESDMLTMVGSLNLVYRSYEKHSTNDQTLRNVAISSKQLFWLNAARDFCSNLVPDITGLSIEQRTNLFFSTQKQFRMDWGCPASSLMGSGESCELW